MEAFVIAAVASILTKVIENTGETVGQKVWEKRAELMQLLKRKSPDTASAIELVTENPELAQQQPEDYGEAVLVEKVESAAKSDSEIAAAVQALADAVKSQPQSIEKITKIADKVEKIGNVNQNTTIENQTFNQEFWLYSPERERVKSNPPQNIPYRGVRNFIGRTRELETLHRELHRGNSVCVISGMGGVGKTELATQYARGYEADYSGGICWLTSRESNLAEGIVRYAQLHMKLNVPQKLEEKKLDPKQQVEWCWQHWQPSEGLVLVVLDDVTDLESCRAVLPTANRFRVLVTTRLRRLDTFCKLPLEVLSPEKALELLADLENEGRVKCEHQIAEELCEWLGYLPLGLELVGRYLAEDPDLCLAEMLERLKAQPQPLQDEALDRSEQQMQQTFSTARRGVRAAFELSWQELNQISQRIGQLLSLFKPTVIPWELVTFSSETQSLGWTTKEIKSAKNELHNLSLIQRIEDRKYYYKIHPLLREFFQAKLAASDQATKLRETFSAAIEAFYNKLANEILEPNINDIEDQVAEDFEQRDFEEEWNERDGFILPLEDITIRIDSVKTIQKKLLDVGKYLFKFELIIEIVFTPEGSYPDVDLSYYDSEEGEVVPLNEITEVGDKNTATIPVKVEIVFDENDPDINEIEFVKKGSIKFDRQPIEFYSNWDKFSSDWEG